MDNQDQGLEDHACSKCGYPCPCSEQRCAHKNICGTIEGYKLFASDYHPYLQGPNSLDSGNNENVNVGTREILSRSVDEVFLDANASFSDGAPSPGSKEPLRDKFDSATHVEIGNVKYQEFSRSSDFNDVNQLTVKSTDDGQMQDPSILQRERVKEGNMLELQRQPSGSQVDPLSSSSITDLRIIEHIDDYFDLSSDSNPSKAEGTPDVLLENKIHAGENVRPCSLASVANDTNLKENDEIKSDSDMFDIAIFSDNTVSGTREEMLKIAVSDVVNSDSQVATRAFNLEEKNNAVLLSVMPQEELSLEVNTTILSTNTSTNGVQVKSAHIIQLATSGVMTMQEMEEQNLNMFTSPVCDDRADVAHSQNECADFEDHKAVLPQNSLSLPSYEAGKLKQDDFKDSDDEDNNILINRSHLSEKREVLPSDGRVLDSSMEELESSEFVDEEMHAEESIDVSSVNFMTESDKTSDEIGASMNCMKYKMIENYMSHFSEKRSTSNAVYKSDDVVEMDRSEKCDITDSQYTERPIVEDPLLPRPAGSNFECPILSEVEEDFFPRTPKDIECANKSPLSGVQDDLEANETNSSCRVNRECNRSISSSAESHQTQNAELLVKAAEEPGLPSNLKEPKAASERQQCENPEMVDPPSMMTVVEPGGLNQQHPSSNSSQAGWFPTLTQRREKNREIIAEKITNNRTSKQNKPLQKSPSREATHSNKPESPKLEEGSNSSADMKRQNKKVKSKSYWTPFTCCSCLDSPPPK